jgi:hypothetical protein
MIACGVLDVGAELVLRSESPLDEIPGNILRGGWIDWNVDSYPGLSEWYTALCDAAGLPPRKRILTETSLWQACFVGKSSLEKLRNDAFELIQQNPNMFASSPKKSTVALLSSVSLQMSSDSRDENYKDKRRVASGSVSEVEESVIEESQPQQQQQLVKQLKRAKSPKSKSKSKQFEVSLSFPSNSMDRFSVESQPVVERPAIQPAPKPVSAEPQWVSTKKTTKKLVQSTLHADNSSSGEIEFAPEKPSISVVSKPKPPKLAPVSPPKPAPEAKPAKPAEPTPAKPTPAPTPAPAKWTSVSKAVTIDPTLDRTEDITPAPTASLRMDTNSLESVFATPKTPASAAAIFAPAPQAAQAAQAQPAVPPPKILKQASPVKLASPPTSPNRLSVRFNPGKAQEPEQRVQNAPSTFDESESVSLGERVNSHVIVTSGLNKRLLTQLMHLATKLGGTLQQNFTPNVTHVIVNTSNGDQAQRTVKYLLGILNGCWIVSEKWIMQSVQLKQWAPCRDSEIQSDVRTTAIGAPTRSRLAGARRLLANVRVHLVGSFVGPSEEEVIQLVQFGGGAVLPLPAAPPLQAILVAPQQLSSAEVTDIFFTYQCHPISVEWLLDSVSHYFVQPYKNYEILPQSAGEAWLQQTQHSPEF